MTMKKWFERSFDLYLWHDLPENKLPDSSNNNHFQWKNSIENSQSLQNTYWGLWLYKLLAADQLDKPYKEINFLKNSFSHHLGFSNAMVKINQMMVPFDTCSSLLVHFITPRQNEKKVIRRRRFNWRPRYVRTKFKFVNGQIGMIKVWFLVIFDVDSVTNECFVLQLISLEFLFRLF